MKILLLAVAISLMGCSDNPQVPVSEELFLRTVAEAQSEWRSSANEIQREPMRKNRDLRLCAVSPIETGWRGTVDHVGLYLNGSDASLSVTVADGVLLRTEGDFQNQGSKIARETSLFETVSKLKKGTTVIFSGHFIKGDGSCFQETSLTDAGSVTNPEFEFSFTDIKRTE